MHLNESKCIPKKTYSYFIDFTNISLNIDHEQSEIADGWLP